MLYMKQKFLQVNIRRSLVTTGAIPNLYARSVAYSTNLPSEEYDSAMQFVSIFWLETFLILSQSATGMFAVPSETEATSSV